MPEKRCGHDGDQIHHQRPLGRKAHTANTWHEPFTEMDEIQRTVNFALSYGVAGLYTAGDTRILPPVLNFNPLSIADREKLIKLGGANQPLFV